jgi:hypothetical protein
VRRAGGIYAQPLTDFDERGAALPSDWKIICVFLVFFESIRLNYSVFSVRDVA